MENDLAVYPENADYTPSWGGIFSDHKAKKEEVKCPFANLF
jgi:hypothetical protein